MDKKVFQYAVTGDFLRLVYSRHASLEAAKKACRKLTRKWGWSHPGSEPHVIPIPRDSKAET